MGTSCLTHCNKVSEIQRKNLPRCSRLKVIGWCFLLWILGHTQRNLQTRCFLAGSQGLNIGTYMRLCFGDGPAGYGASKQMKKLFVAGIAAAAFCGMPAFAADMAVPPPMPPPTPPFVPVYSWSGLYVGGEFGYKWMSNNWDTTCVQGGGLLQCGNAPNAAAFPGAPDSTAQHRFSNSGVRPGVYAGYMFEMGRVWVTGIEGEWASYKQSSSVAGIPGCSTAACTGGALVPFSLSGDSASIINKSDASLRLRAGYLMTRDVLLYGTGGFAVQKVGATAVCTINTSPACLLSHSQTNYKTMSGYTIGGGVEWKLYQNWLIRGEYRYSDYGTWKTNFFVNSGDVEFYTNVKVTSQILTVGLAYMFPILW
jgi:outer membrane immunogenic protein